MHRFCFRLSVRPDKLDDYRRRHAVVWPDMLRALASCGWRNYSIFAAPNGEIIGYVEAADLAASQRAMAALEVNTRWQNDMRQFFTGLDGGAPDEHFELFEEIFNLDDQLARAVEESR